MNTKNKIIAILMASVVAMAVGVPMAMSAAPPTYATVNNVAPTIDAIASDPDTNVTMNSCPDTTPVNITATVSDINGVDDIANVTVAISGGISGPVDMTCTNTGDTTKSCYKVFNLDCSQASGSYTATVNVTDDTGAFDNVPTDTFFVDPKKALSINFDKVTFTGDPDSPDNAGVANITSGTVANVTSTGNAVIDIGVEASNLSSTTTGDSINGNNMNATIGGVGPAVVKPKNTFDTNTVCDEDESAAFTLTIPEAILPASNYQGTLTISAE